MCDWPEVRVSDLATIEIGGTPPRAIPAFWAEKPSGYPWISIADLKGKYVLDTKEHITTLGVRSSNVKLIPEGTTVMSFKLTVGRTAITAREMYCNEAIAIFQPKDRRVDGMWLYHALPRASVSVVTDTAVKGATLNKSKMAEMSLRLPSPPEQSYIAQVLDTLDTAIHETEAIIAKLKAVKQGLLHDLLTRGIDANGELRPPQTAAPQLYKESALGWIPKEWTPVPLGKFASLQRGHDIVESRFRAGPYPVISSSGIIGHHAAATSRGPNVVVGRKGSIGTVHYVESDFWAHDTSLFVTNFFGNDAKFVCYLFGYMQLAQYGTKSGSPSLNRNDVHPLMISRPDGDEQHRIVAASSAHDGLINRECLELAKLRQIKLALMDDLLTGRVRVTPLLEDAAP